MTANSLNRNLVLDIRGRNTPIKPGETILVERELILRNRSDRTIHVDLWIEPSDAKAMPLRQWCQFSNPNPTLEPRQEQQVQLQLEIPSQAEPGFYSYEVCAQTPEFVEEVERRPQKLEVLASEQIVTLRNEPEFYLTPPTSSEQPYQLIAGTPFTFQVTIENRSKRVDRLFLTCPELPPEWFEIEYPEVDIDTPGRIAQTNGLQLNPSNEGTITLHLHPPGLTPAGNYSTTLRLTSANQNNLVLLDILYFTVQVNEEVTLSLNPAIGHIPGSDSEFIAIVRNLGNIQRELMVRASDADSLFNFKIDPNPISLMPGEIAHLLVTPATRKWWRRQWRYRQEIPFKVEVANELLDIPEEDVEAMELKLIEPAPQQTLALPPVVEGKLIWESRPSWLRWLLIALLLAGILSGISVLTYWLVKKLVVEPSLEPRVVEFSSLNESYQAQSGNPIQLDWEISNFDKLSIAGLTFFNRNTKNDLPLSLPPGWLKAQDSCQEDTRQVRPILRLLYRIYNEAPETNLLICQGLQITPPDLEPPTEDPFEFRVGAYDATLNLYTSEESETAISSSDSSEDELSPTSNITTPNDSDVPQQSFEIGLLEDSDVAELSKTDSKKVSNIEITPSDPPEILYFYSKSPTYREPSTSDITQTPAAFRTPESTLTESPEITDEAQEMDSEVTNSSSDETEAAENSATETANTPNVSPFPPLEDEDSEPSTSDAVDDQEETDSTIDNAEVPELNEVAASGSEEVADIPPQTDSLTPIRLPVPTVPDVAAQVPFGPVELTWVIDRPWEIEALELSYIAIAADGTVVDDRITYPMLNDEPVGLEDLCRPQDNGRQLICEDVPTPANVAGEYTFKLTAVMPADQNRDEIVKETDPIEVRPPFPQILSFMVNGKQAAEHPQQVHFVNSARGTVDLMLEWEIASPERMKVEILPAPGVVNPGTTQMPFSVSPTPGSTSLTLQVSNGVGEMVSRNVVIATAAPSPTVQPIVPIPTQVPPGLPLPPPPLLPPPTPSQLEPIQAPPSGN